MIFALINCPDTATTTISVAVAGTTGHRRFVKAINENVSISDNINTIGGSVNSGLGHHLC